MNDIKLKYLNNTSHHYILNNLKTIQNHLNDIVANSDIKLIQNLIEETKIILEKCCDDSISYRQRAELYSIATTSWFDLLRHYNHILEAIGLGYFIDDLTNCLGAYTKLLLGMSMVNEEKNIDSPKTIKGYGLIAETIDIFVHVFSISELTQFYENAKKILSDVTYNLKEYFKDSTEKRELVIQLRGYCSLIILRINEYLSQKELLSQETTKVNSSSSLWWENISGTFADDSLYDEAMKLGQECHNSKNTFIKLKIEKFIEDENDYYVATSSDLEGLVAEGKTIKEVIDIAEDVARVLLELEKENNTDIITNNPPSIFEYPLILEA